jgi:hypothetical protein
MKRQRQRRRQRQQSTVLASKNTISEKHPAQLL